ncbi:MAG TPA: BON domain-containing protein [Thermoanaerobaculia bacterium]|jgi:osmotically-inducible protein OsmY
MKKTLGFLLALALLGALSIGPAAADDKTTDDEGIVQEISDGLLGLKVKASLLQELGISAMGIEVTARTGEVTLSGKVDEKPTQELAEEVAAALDGVRSVHNDIRIEKVAQDSKRPVGDAVGHAESEVKDAALETKVKTRLVGEIGRHAFRIEVEASNGVVSLRGKVPDENRRKLALETARNTSGVDRVIDLLEEKDA